LEVAGSNKETEIRARVCALWFFVYSLLGSFAHVAYEQVRKMLMIVDRIWQNFSVLK
jgi:hypothetical protein